MALYDCTPIPTSDGTTQYRVSATIHGTGVCNCGSYPLIKLVFLLTCIRASGSDLVTFRFTDVGWEHPVTGTFGYHIQSSVSVADGVTAESDRHTIIYKDNDTRTSWWTRVAVHSEPFELSINSAQDVVYLNYYAGGVNGWGCVNGNINCYGAYGPGTAAGNGNQFLYNIPITVPPRETKYTLTYDKNASKATNPNPPTQLISDSIATTINSTVQYPFTIYYKYGGVDLASDKVLRNHTEWYEGKGGTGTIHPNGSELTLQSDTTYYAKWEDVVFTPKSFSRTATITFNSNGGSACPSILVSNPGRPCTYYSLTPGGSSAYIPGQQDASYMPPNTDTDVLNLYANYGEIEYSSANLPIPTKEEVEFGGWYYDRECTRKVSSTVVVDSDIITLYAKWIEYPIKHFDGNWYSRDKLVWVMTESGWKKTAPIYQADSNNHWNKILG